MEFTNSEILGALCVIWLCVIFVAMGLMRACTAYEDDEDEGEDGELGAGPERIEHGNFS